jgi:hypothetical protein
MTSTVATEIPESTPAKSLLETWGKNERMRHIPPIEWIITKLDVDLRRRIDILVSSFAAIPAGDPRRASAEPQFTALGRAIDRLGDLARYTRAVIHHNGSDLAARLREAIDRAVASLRAVDPSLFGRRHPFQTFERSKGEPLFAALLVVIQSTRRIVSILRDADHNLDQHLLEGIVTLQEPLREQPMA